MGQKVPMELVTVTETDHPDSGTEAHQLQGTRITDSQGQDEG